VKRNEREKGSDRNHNRNHSLDAGVDDGVGEAVLLEDESSALLLLIARVAAGELALEEGGGVVGGQVALLALLDGETLLDAGGRGLGVLGAEGGRDFEEPLDAAAAGHGERGADGLGVLLAHGDGASGGPAVGAVDDAGDLHARRGAGRGALDRETIALGVVALGDLAALHGLLLATANDINLLLLAGLLSRGLLLVRVVLAGVRADEREAGAAIRIHGDARAIAALVELDAVLVVDHGGEDGARSVGRARLVVGKDQLHVVVARVLDPGVEGGLAGQEARVAAPVAGAAIDGVRVGVDADVANLVVAVLVAEESQVGNVELAVLGLISAGVRAVIAAKDGLDHHAREGRHRISSRG